MRIGEILLLREAVDPIVLSNAIQEQPATGLRLVSLLISRALIDPDEATLALSEKFDVAGALQRHLERRDPAVAELLPAELARRWVVMPLGRSRRGGLVVVARDPSPFLEASLEHILGTRVYLAVTPALLLERLVRSVYGDLEPLEPSASSSGAIPHKVLEDDVLSLRTPRRSRTVSQAMIDTNPMLQTPRAPSITKELDATLGQIEHAVNPAAAEQFAMTFASRRWHSGLLLIAEGGAFFGRRGFGPKLGAPEAVILPIGVPSVVQRAYETRLATQDVVPGPLHERLVTLLGSRAPIAAPVITRGGVEAVLLVGDPTTSELRQPVTKLAALADALGAAYERFPR